MKKVLLAIFLWILVPVGVGFAGYYFIAPQFEKVAPDLQDRVSSLARGSQETTTTTTSEEPIKKFKEPNVEVEVADAPRVRATRRTEQVEPEPEAADPLLEAPEDEVGSAARRPERRRKRPEPEPQPETAPEAGGNEAGGTDPDAGDEAGSGGAATGGDPGTTP